MLERQADPERVQQFLTHSLDFRDGSFGGALVWDTLQFLTPALLETASDRLYNILEPDASLYLMFHGNEKAKTVPTYSYRIASSRSITLVPRGERVPAQILNNRSIERIFQRWTSVKFFLARDSLREVVVRR